MDDLTKEREEENIPLRSIIKDPLRKSEGRIRWDRMKGHEVGHVQWWNEVFDPPPMQDQAYRHPHFMKEQEHLSSASSSPSPPSPPTPSTTETETGTDISTATTTTPSTISQESDEPPDSIQG